MKKITGLTLLCTLSIFSSSYVYAESPLNTDKTFFLDEYVVTANKTEQKIIDTNANINVITKEDIEQKHYTTLEEALHSVPGVQFKSYGGDGTRNANMNQPLMINGSTKVVILIDGVRINAFGNRSSFNPALFTSMDNIERIEVLKGAAGTLYGSDAVGGVINIITKNIDENKTTVRYSAGSFSQINEAFINQGIIQDDATDNKFTWNIYYNKNKSGNYKSGKGTEYESDYDGETKGIKLQNEISKHKFTLQYDKNNSDFNHVSNDGNRWKYTDVGKLDDEAILFTHDYKIDDDFNNKFIFRKGKYELNYRKDNYDYNWNSYTKGIDNGTYYKLTSISNQMNKKFNDYNNIIVGYEHNKVELGTKKGFKWTEWVPGYGSYMEKEIDNINWDAGNIESDSYYLQHNWQIDNKWDFTSGIRYNKASLKSPDSVSDDYQNIIPGTSKSIDGNWSKSFTLSHKFDDKHNAYIGYHDYFVVPDPVQISNSDSKDSLNPAKGRNYSLGYNHIFDESSQMAIHAFYRDGEEIILTTGSTYQNIDDSKTVGFDIQFSKQINKNWNSYIGYQYLHHNSDSDSDNLKLGYLPRHELNIGINYSKDKWNAGLEAKAMLDRDGGCYGGNDLPWTKDRYWVVNLSANYKPTENIKVFATANNIFDTYYEESVDWGNEGGNIENIYAMPGRSFLLGVEYSF